MSVGSDPHASERTTTRWKASWSSGKRAPSREAPERRSWPPRQAKHRSLSKGAAARGAAEETPILSQQRVGDKGCSAGIRGGELTQCASPSLNSVGPEEFLAPAQVGAKWPASLAAVGLRLRQDFSGSLRNLCLFGDGDSPTQENDKPREGRDDPMRARILALEGCARTSNLVCRSR
jgi:hypothetical protein